MCSGSYGFFTQCPKEAECCPIFMFPRYRSYRNNDSYLCYLSQHAWQREGGLAFGVRPQLSQILHVSSSSGKTKRDSAQRNCLHSGAALLQVEFRVALSLENPGNGDVERLRAPTPILCCVRQTYLV